MTRPIRLIRRSWLPAAPSSRCTVSCPDGRSPDDERPAWPSTAAFKPLLRLRYQIAAGELSGCAAKAAKAEAEAFMRTGYSTAAVLVGLALICLVGWAASHAPAPASSNAISATISPQPAPAPTQVPACRASQLSLTYLTGQPVGGHDFGIIAIWDKSAAGCSLTGPVLLTGLSQAGHPVTQDLTYEVSAPGTLTAHGLRPQEGMQMGQGER